MKTFITSIQTVFLYPFLALHLVGPLTCPGWADPVVINFDDRPGMSPPFIGGTAVPLEFLIHDQYLPWGVLFDSEGGGIAITAAANPVSAPNTAAATEPGPVLSYEVPITATFMVDGLPAVVDFVQLDLSSSSSQSTLRAFNADGLFLGSDSGEASATLQVAFPGLIHYIVLEQGPAAFDNFTFDGLTPIPEPSALVLLSAGVAGLLLLRRLGIGGRNQAG